jgi:hypothetical protein
MKRFGRPRLHFRVCCKLYLKMFFFHFHLHYFENKSVFTFKKKNYQIQYSLYVYRTTFKYFTLTFFSIKQVNDAKVKEQVSLVDQFLQ